MELPRQVSQAFSCHPAPAATSEDIRPFRTQRSEEALVDLRRRQRDKMLTGKRSPMNRKACSSRRCRKSRALGDGL
jgi:hypothetical protein